MLVVIVAAVALGLAPVAPEGYVPPPVGPLVYADTLTFTAPGVAVLNDDCSPVGQSGEAFEYVEVWRCSFQNDYRPWAPWMSAWHLHRRIRCAPGERVLMIGLKRFHYRVRAVDASGNAACWSNVADVQ